MRQAVRRLFELVGSARLIVAVTLAVYFFPLVVLGRDMRSRFGVLPQYPRFLDLRSVTSGWACDDRGIDVLRDDPCDPLGRAFNYPRLWLLPGKLGLGPEHTRAIGITIVCVFLVMLLVLVGRSPWWHGVFWAAAAVSPPVQLGIERGNIDLVVFSVLAAGLLALRHRRVAGEALLLLAAVLKLFPAFAFAALLRGRQRELLGAAAIIGLFLAYAAATADDLRLIDRGTPKGPGLSYGAAVLRDQLVGGGDHPWLVALIVLAAVALALAAARLRTGGTVGIVEERTRALDLFRASGATYVGTYALLYDADYRLAFCLLALPQLLRWAEAPRAPVPFPRIGLALLLLTLWFSTDAPATPVVGWIFTRWNARVDVKLDEIFGWLLCTFMIAALCKTLPPLLRWPATRLRPASAAPS